MSLKHGIMMLALACALTACAGSSQSLVERGEPVDTGRREFDQYFEKVEALSRDTKALDGDMFEVRQRLVEELDLNVDVALGVLLKRTKERVEKAKGYGTAMTLQLTPSPTVRMDRGKLEASDKDEALFTAIQQSAEKAMDNYKKRSDLLLLAAELEAQRGTLAERIDKLPPSAADKKELIETEIVGAGRVIADSEDTLLRQTRTLTHLLIGLVEATNTGALETRDIKCDEAIAFFDERKKDEAKPKPPRNRYQGRPAAAPRPAPRPAAGGDFEM